MVLSLAKATGLPVRAVHQHTGFDHPDTYRHLGVMEAFYGIPIEYTENPYGGMLPYLDAVGFFPNALFRDCTKRLKQGPFAAWLLANGFDAGNAEIWFGMRAEESVSRDTKFGKLADDDVFTLGELSEFYRHTKARRASIAGIPVRLPIVTLWTRHVFRYLANEGAPLNPLYGRGHTRVGCYPCLLARKREWQAVATDPVGREHIAALVAREDAWTAEVPSAEARPKKFIRVHRLWDVRTFLGNGADTLPESGESACGMCEI
jgi:3'-phosphoadenosine 5'-phosphosulfate sulfotransferase (PAPS reductase)/FAD synthetase